MKINSIVPGSLVDGEGIRYTIFFQGCPHQCDGCHSPHTWDITKYNIELTADQVINDIKRYKKYINGITLSGGDPLFQIKDIYEFLRKLRMDKDLKDMPVWLYTGYEFEDIPKSITTYLDVIKCGPYVKELESIKWAGSSNQRLFRKQNETINGNHWIQEETKNE